MTPTGNGEIHHDHSQGEISLDNSTVVCHTCHETHVHNRVLKFKGRK